MSIESSSAPQSHKAVSGADHRGGKKAGKADSLGEGAAAGFSVLMSLLAATDVEADATTLAGDPALLEPPVPGVTVGMTTDEDKNGASALAGSVLEAMNLIANQGMTAAPVLAVISGGLPGLTGASQGLGDAAVDGGEALDFNRNGAVALAEPALAAMKLIPMPETGAAPVVAGTGSLPIEAEGGLRGKRPPSSALVGVGAANPAEAANPLDTASAGGQPLMDEPLALAPLDGLPVRKTAQQSQNLLAALSELREPKSHSATLDLATTPVISNAMVMSGAGDGLVNPLNRLGARPVPRSGAAGEGVFGSVAMVNARADAPYTIEAATAAVPDTAIAETVSYWVTHGVQNAELKLEGFGSEPVEVSISLNGDQAQIDFRTDQASVRSILEAATTQLRDLLSGEGLQLSGVSVGASGGREAQGDNRQQKQTSRQALVVPDQALGVLSNRIVNPSVGQTLDLFV